MAAAEAPDMITPGIEDVIANARMHGNAGAGDHTMVLNMGPQHPSTHGVLRLVLEIDGESIVALAPDIGYLHTGIEKTCEAKFYQQVVPMTEVGDLIQVTHIDIDKDRITFELNGGNHSDRKKWYDHVQIGMGTQTTPISQGGATNAPAGVTLALNFGAPIGELNSADVKKMMQPILDFEKESVTENYVDTLPEPIKEAVKARKAIEGMNRDQVILAVGRPLRKSRESKEGTEYEDWIFGEPPGRVTFVTFAGDKVVKVKETYAGLGGSVAEIPQQP